MSHHTTAAMATSRNEISAHLAKVSAHLAEVSAHLAEVSAHLAAEHRENLHSDQDDSMGSGEGVVEEVSRNSAALQVPTKDDKHSPFLQLPTELRLSIYDMLFEPVAQQELKHLHTYVFPFEWPEKLATYTTLLLVCKQLQMEVSEYFEAQYLPNMTLYFDNVPDLRQFARKVASLGPGYEKVQICLHTSTHADWVDNWVDNNSTKPSRYWLYGADREDDDVSSAIDCVAEDVVQFICYQAEAVCGVNPAFNSKIPDRYRHEYSFSWPEWLPSEFGTVSRSSRLFERVDVLQASMPWSNLKISLH